MVPKKARCIGALCVTVFFEVLDQSCLTELAGLGQTVHAFSYLEVDVLVVEERTQVVLVYDSQG